MAEDLGAARRCGQELVRAGREDDALEALQFCDTTAEREAFLLGVIDELKEKTHAL